MPKKLISVRLSEDLLQKIKFFRNNKNLELSKYKHKQPIHTREGSLCDVGYRSYIMSGPSVADVIEIALLEFFKDKNL